MIDLLLLHTSEALVSRFNGLRDTLDPDLRMEHILRRDWLLRASRHGVTLPLRLEIETFVAQADAPVLCSCEVLGDTIEEAGGHGPTAPMMRRAALRGAPVVVVTARPGRIAALQDRMQACLDAAGQNTDILALDLSQFQPLLEVGDDAGFHAAVAAALIDVATLRPEFRTMVLADSDMIPVTHLLDGMGLDLLEPSKPAFRATLDAVTNPAIS